MQLEEKRDRFNNEAESRAARSPAQSSLLRSTPTLLRKNGQGSNRLNDSAHATAQNSHAYISYHPILFAFGNDHDATRPPPLA